MTAKYIRFAAASSAPARPDGQSVVEAVAVGADGEPVDVGGAVPVAAHVDPSSGTVADVVNALVAAGLRASE